MHISQKTSIFIFTLGIGAFLSLFMFVIFKNLLKNSREEFVNLSQEAQQKIRSNEGIEKCDTLFKHIETMPDKEHTTMTHYIDGLRVRKWKPNESDEMYEEVHNNRNNQSKEYCYLYDDYPNKMKDLIMSDDQDTISCSKENPLFQSSFIRNVFQSDKQDKGHQAPIKKCVFEIDKTKLSNNQSELTQFWSNWNSTNCKNISSDLRQVLSEKKHLLTSLSKELYDKENKLRIEQEKISLLESQLQDCHLNTININSQINNLRKQYEETNALNQIIIQDISIYEQNIDHLKNIIEELEKNVEENRRIIRELEEQKDDCHNESLNCFRDKEDFQVIINDRLERNHQLQISIADLNDRIERYQSLKITLENKLEECRIKKADLENELSQLLEKRDRFTNKLNECQTKLQEHIRNYERDLPKYEASLRAFNNCRNDVSILEIKLRECINKVKNCVNGLNNAIYEYNNLEEDGHDDDYQKNYPECSNIETENQDNIDTFFGSRREHGDIDINDLSDKYDAVTNKINTMRNKINCKRKNFNVCKEENESLAAQILELERRREQLIEHIREQKDYQTRMKNDSYNSIADNVQNETNKMRDDYIRAIDDNFNKNIENSCSLKTCELDAELEEQENENKRLTSRLQGISQTNMFERTCEQDCDISIAQCKIHQNNPSICTIPQSSSSSSIYGSSQTVTVSVYDQNDAKIATYRFERPNQEVFITNTANTDLKFFVVEIQEPLENDFTYVAATQEGNKCPSKPGNIDSKFPYSVGKIPFGSTYRKIHLYRGTTCLKLFSSNKGAEYGKNISLPKKDKFNEFEPDPPPPSRTQSDFKCGHWLSPGRFGGNRRCNYYLHKETNERLHASDYEKLPKE